MPTPLTYPGVYIEEVPSGVRTITGVATSITAFIGRALRGPVDKPVRIQSYADFERAFGGLWEESTMSYAVQQYFLNDGVDAVIARVHRGGTVSVIELDTAVPAEKVVLESANPGHWGRDLRARVDHTTKEDPDDTTLFNLIIEEMDGNVVARTETFRNVSALPASPRFLIEVLKQQSQLVRATAVPGQPSITTDPVEANDDGDHGQPIENDDIIAGLALLEETEIFNLLCIPPLERDVDIDAATRDAAAAYCEDRRALFIVDAPADWTTVDLARTGMENIANFMTRSKNAAAFFPRIKAVDPLKDNRLEEFAPCGTVAGIIARTDTTRGVWKAPAGTDAVMRGVREFVVKMTDLQNGQLNPLGLNSLRSFPVYGSIVWGSRTLVGADALASEWKYIPVRRLALFLEESLYRGTQWVVFEPNDEPLWSQIRLNLGAFMHNLFRQGAFQGTSPREAYFVKCDKETTTQNDINLGIVNIVVGFAPLKPAEFVVIKIQQMAGQVAV
ncbi:MAG TPA: phage tail sheath subtilisin-like domain-containing protein [Thermoanaerobaculia bacterium]